jgi:hypothetical protein
MPVVSTPRALAPSGAAKLSVRVDEFKPFKSNTLRGFVDLFVPEMRMRVFGATVHQSHGKRWIGLPAKPQLGPDGCARRDPRTGKILYIPVLQFADKRTADAFSQRGIEALLARWPHAFDGGDP